MASNMSVFNTQISTFADLVKKYLFQVEVIFDNDAVKGLVLNQGANGIDDFVFRAKTVSIPAKEFSDMSTEYMGSKLVYPGKPTVSGEVSIQFDEFQDMWVSKTFHAWQQLIWDQAAMDNHPDFYGQAAGTIPGGAYSNYMYQYCATLIVKVFASDAKQQVPIEWHLVRCWPKNFQGFDLGAEDDGKVTRTVTFAYSNFSVVSTGTVI